jgi:hypothetical protein
MSGETRYQALGEYPNQREHSADSKGGEQAASALIEMCQAEKRCGAENTCDPVASGPVLKERLNETPINELFTYGNRYDESKKGESFNGVLREEFERELRQEAHNFSGLRDKAAETKDLVREDERRKENRDGGHKGRVGNRQAELSRMDAVRVRAPKNGACGKPLKRDRGSVQRQAVHLRCLGHLHQLTDPPPPEPGHGDSEDGQNEREVPMHRFR